MRFQDWWRANKRDWPQVDIAKHLEVTPGAVQRWIQGERVPKDAEIAEITVMSKGECCILDWYPLSAEALEYIDEMIAKHKGEKDESKLKAIGSPVPVIGTTIRHEDRGRKGGR